jgi:hypothetical protein
MMKRILWIILIAPPVLAFMAKPSTFEIKVLGTYTDAIAGNSKERIDLKSLDLKRKSFGIGLDADSRAEILIYKGKIFKSSFNNKGIITEKTNNSTASYIVYTSVRKWESYLLPSTIRSLADLETEIAKVIENNNYTGSGTIPFLLIGNPISANWHIEVTPGTNKQLNNRGFFFEDKIKAVGFFTTDQQGVITEMNSRIHVHVTNKRKEIVGHLDDIKMAGGMTLWMPKLK